MRHELRELDDADAAATAAADHLADLIRSAVSDRGEFSMAVSGGRSPWTMFTRLAQADLPWGSVGIWQVDERIAASGDRDRNLVGLTDALGATDASIHPMPVEGLSDPTIPFDTAAGAACDAYAATLPDRFDVIHLGLGPDGHTASLVPGDAVLDVADRRVAATEGSYQGHRRMTFTFPGLARTRSLMWLVTGADKHAALSGLLTGDRSYPAARVDAARSLVVTDRAALRGVLPS